MTLPPVTFPTLGWQVLDWIEAYLCHGPGDVQGEKWAEQDHLSGMGIDDEEALFICWLYRVHPQGHPLAGRRLVRRAIYSRPKGRRKSEIAGALMCAEALGPVRCDGFDAYGEPVGVPVRYPFIRCLATEEEQAGNTYDNVTYMLANGEAANTFEFDIGRSAETSSRVILRGKHGGEIIPSTSGNASKDGGKESAACADETHLYTLPQLRGMYRTVSRNTGKRKVAEPYILDTTTMFQPGENSVAEQAERRYAKVPTEEAVVRSGVLYDHREGLVPERFGDDRSLIKALKPGYGPAADWMDFRRIVQIIRDAEDPEEEAYRYFLNIKRQTKEQWLSPDELDAVIDLDLRPADGSMIALGFDGSENDDHTVLQGCTEDGDLFAIGAWTPKVEEGLDWRAEVDAAVEWAFRTFQVVRFYPDPAWWQSEVGAWAARHSDRRRPGTLPVLEFWTGSRNETRMAVATGALRTAIRQQAVRINPVPLRTEPQTMGGLPLVQWHFQNAKTKKVRIKPDDDKPAEDAYLIRKDRKGSPLKIDGATAGVLARRARDDAMKAGEFEKRSYGSAQW